MDLGITSVVPPVIAASNRALRFCDHEEPLKNLTPESFLLHFTEIVDAMKQAHVVISQAAEKLSVYIDNAEAGKEVEPLDLAKLQHDVVLGAYLYRIGLFVDSLLRSIKGYISNKYFHQFDEDNLFLPNAKLGDRKRSLGRSMKVLTMMMMMRKAKMRIEYQSKHSSFHKNVEKLRSDTREMFFSANEFIKVALVFCGDDFMQEKGMYVQVQYVKNIIIFFLAKIG